MYRVIVINNMEHLNNGCELIAKERERQINELGYDVKNDELYSKNELSDAAICYAMTETRRFVDNFVWPWDKKFWKPTPEDRIKELTKAGALIAAQIDRELHELSK